MKKFGCSFPSKYEDQPKALFSVLCTYATQKTSDVILMENRAKPVVGIPTKVSQELLEKVEAISPEGNSDVVFLRLLSRCLGSVLTVEVILNK